MGEIIASPSARRLAVRNKIELERLATELGSDTISRADVERKIAEKRTEGQNRSSCWDVDHSAWGPARAQKRSRLEIAAAANLAAAVAAIPQVTTSARANCAKLESARRSLNLRVAEKGIKITAVALQIAALARVLHEFPKFNSSLSADGKTLWLKGYVSIGVAVDTPHGLVVPVIRNADKKGLETLAQELRCLADRARSRKLLQSELGGASMSVSNLGRESGTGFTPIINPPESAILGVSRMSVEPVWNGREFKPEPVVPLDLTYDHRIVNGVEAARFLSGVVRMLEEPNRLLY